MSLKQKHKNHLFLIRKKIGLDQKQVARLLGHKTTDQISRYERGTKLPSLKTALKLSSIYRLPINILLYGYCEACLNELNSSEKNLKIGKNSYYSADKNIHDEIEFCTYEEKLKLAFVKKPDLDKAHHHIAELVKVRSQKMKHSSE